MLPNRVYSPAELRALTRRAGSPPAAPVPVAAAGPRADPPAVRRTGWFASRLRRWRRDALRRSAPGTV